MPRRESDAERVGLRACGVPQGEQPYGDRKEERESDAKSPITLELPLLELTSGLQRLEEFFYDPPCSIGVDDGRDLLCGRDRFSRYEVPGNRLVAK